jgi:hypothetical protein
MQKFGFLNYGRIKDVSSCSIHLQSVFSARTDHLKTKATGKSRTDFTDSGFGIFCIGRVKCRGEHLDGFTKVFKQEIRRNSPLDYLGEWRISRHSVNINAEMIRRSSMTNQPNSLFSLLRFFVPHALIAECIGDKIFSPESTLGFMLFSFSLFGK